jgi:hypothetical protein
VRNVPEGLVEQRRDVLIVERVEALTAPALGHYKTMLAQDPELMGNSGLLHPDHVCELADCVRSLAQAGEDPNPARCREREHRVRDRVRRFARQLIAGGTVAHDRRLANMKTCSYVISAPRESKSTREIVAAAGAQP